MHLALVLAYSKFKPCVFSWLLWKRIFQNLHRLYGSIDINGTVIAGIITTGFHCLSGFIAGLAWGLKGGTTIFCVTVEDIPAGSQLDQPSEARQRKALIMDQMGNLSYLRDIEIGINAVIGPGFPPGFYQPHFFVLAYGLLGQIHFPGYITDEVFRRFLTNCKFCFFIVQICPQTTMKNQR